MKRIGLLALLALALAVPASASAAGGPKVTVIGEDNRVVAEFYSAKCRRAKSGSLSFFAAVAKSSNGKYRLEVHMDHFSGFHDYDVTLGSPDPEILVEPLADSSGAGDFGNRFKPPYPVPGFGAIKFAADGKSLGVGFAPAMWSRDRSEAVVLAGGMKCKYAKKKGK